MYPKLFGVEFLNTFGLLLAIGVIMALVMFRFNCGKKKIPDRPYNHFLTIAVISIGVGFLFAFLFQMLYDGIEFLVNAKPGAKFEPGGITFLGGMIGGVGGFLIGFRIFAKPDVKVLFWEMANLCVPSFLIAHAIGRMGCFSAGCCYGHEAPPPAGIYFPVHGKSYIPTQLYEGIFLFIMFAVSMIVLYKTKKGEYLMAGYCVSYAIFRFIIEFYRGDDRGFFLFGLSPSQLQSIVLLLIGIAILYFINIKKHIPYKASAEEALAAIKAQEEAKGASEEFYESADPVLSTETVPASVPDPENKDAAKIDTD